MSGSGHRPMTSVRSARDLVHAPHPSVPMTTRLEDRIVIDPAGDPFSVMGDDVALTRIGFLSDMPTGDQLGGYLDPIILAFEDAMTEGRLTRPVELLASHVVGLPVGQAENVIAAYLDLVDRGCIIVLSTGVTNNALVLCDVINERMSPYITMAGTTRFVGEHCFSLANGGHGEEAAILAAFLADQGFRRVVAHRRGHRGRCRVPAVLSRSRRRSTASRSSTSTTSTAPRATTRSTPCSSASATIWTPTHLCYCGFGINSEQLGHALNASGGTRPGSMNAAIMWALRAAASGAKRSTAGSGSSRPTTTYDEVEKNQTRSR